MHSPELRNKFMKLRADGWGLTSISEQLNVPKSTLWLWDHQEKDRIHQLKQIAQDTMDEDYHTSRECELGALYGFYETLQDSLAKNLCTGAQFLSIKENWQLLQQIRAEIEKLRIKPLLNNTGQPVPPDPGLVELEEVNPFQRSKQTQASTVPGPIPLEAVVPAGPSPEPAPLPSTETASAQTVPDPAPSAQPSPPSGSSESPAPAQPN